MTQHTNKPEGGHEGPPMTFAMPMMHNWVPQTIRPWIYIVQAICFQLSGGIYMGALDEMVGEHCWLREDVTFLLNCTLAGMAIWFPVLFRMKFHFSNKFLLMTSATVILISNLISMHKLPLPVMWVVCLLCGCAKIQGTFECMSTIQLWITPKRDFGIFFSVLHIILLGAMEGTGWMATKFAHHMHWSMMHWLVIGLMLLVLSTQALLTRPFCPMPPERRAPLYDIDWLSAIGWVSFFLLGAYVLVYGETLQWWHSSSIQLCTASSLIILAMLMVRMLHNKQSYIEAALMRYRYFRPVIFLIFLFEVIMSVEHVAEGIYLGSVMHYNEMVSEELGLWSLAGSWAGCLFTYYWLGIIHSRRSRLIIFGMSFICLYCMSLYFLVTPTLDFNHLTLPMMARGFGYAILCVTFMDELDAIMSFQHFFQALCIFNFFHMFVGGNLGAALLSHGINYYMADGFARYNGNLDLVVFSAAPFDFSAFLNNMSEGLLAQSVKILYGWTIYACLLFIAIFLLWERPFVQRYIKRMPSWSTVSTWVLMRCLRR